MTNLFLRIQRVRAIFHKETVKVGGIIPDIARATSENLAIAALPAFRYLFR